MNDSVAESSDVLATYIVVDDQALTVSLNDGRKLTLPLDWYPRLKHGSPAERNHWRLIGEGVGIHWPDLDEDLSVESFLAGRRSIETAASVRKWLAERSSTKKRHRKSA